MNYPENLLTAIMGSSTPEMTEDIHATLLYVVTLKCSERERNFLILRYRDGYTYQQIADTSTVTRERVRQIIEKALRRLRTGTSGAMLSTGLMVWLDTQLKQQRVLSDEKIGEMTAMYENRIKDMLGEEKSSSVGDSITIEDMDLSVRSYNCLYRAGIRTLSDITALTMKRLSMLRNFGHKSYTEVMDKIHSYGMTLSDEPKGGSYEEAYDRY